MTNEWVNNRIEYYKAENILQENHEWDKWLKEIPSISLPEGYAFVPIPPFSGAVARFLVRKNGKQVSIYLDCYSMLGIMNAPYWELYPAANDDTARFDMNDVEGLTQAIIKSLED